MRKKVLPERLKKGEFVGVVALSDPVNGVCPRGLIERGYKYLNNKGYPVLEGESIKVSTTKHTVGDVDFKVDELHSMLKNKKVKCIMTFWGGLNTNQLLDKLDYNIIKNNPKIIIGYSDTTALTTAITTKTGLVTFSGPALISFAKPDPFKYTWDYFADMCINPKPDLRIQPSTEYADDLYFLRDDDMRIKKRNKGIKVFREGTAAGEVIVGNLQTLLLLQSTEYLPDLKGKILFLEEDESSTVAHADRFICQCKQLGWFSQIDCLIFGRFTEMSGFSETDSFEDILNFHLEGTTIPVLYNVDFGHSDPMITIPNGGHVVVDTYKKSIIFKQAVT